MAGHAQLLEAVSVQPGVEIAFYPLKSSVDQQLLHAGVCVRVCVCVCVCAYVCVNLIEIPYYSPWQVMRSSLRLSLSSRVWR